MKTKTQHTPGPWEYVESYDNLDGRQFATFELDSKATGHMGSYQAAKEITKWEAEANARLIAAAPDLLDALNYIRDSDDNERSATRLSNHAMQVVNAAIAKAEGGK